MQLPMKKAFLSQINVNIFVCLTLKFVDDDCKWKFKRARKSIGIMGMCGMCAIFPDACPVRMNVSVILFLSVLTYNLVPLHRLGALRLRIKMIGISIFILRQWDGRLDGLRGSHLLQLVFQRSNYVGIFRCKYHLSYMMRTRYIPYNDHESYFFTTMPLK